MVRDQPSIPRDLAKVTQTCAFRARSADLKLVCGTCNNAEAQFPPLSARGSPLYPGIHAVTIQQTFQWKETYLLYFW